MTVGSQFDLCVCACVCVTQRPLICTEQARLVGVAIKCVLLTHIQTHTLAGTSVGPPHSHFEASS